MISYKSKSKKIDISIVIPAYNASKTIVECIQSIENSDFNKKYEIIVVNDGSKDDTLEKIKDFKVRIINQENKGSATAKNTGAKAAKSNLLIFVDSDITFFENTLAGLYNDLKKPGVDCVTALYSRKPINKRWIHKYKALADYCYSFLFIHNKKNRSKPIKNINFAGGVDGIKKHVFEKIGGFNEKIKGADVERERMYIELYRHNFTLLSNSKNRTKHNFPNFKTLVKNYFFRGIHYMRLRYKENYNPKYMQQNKIRILLGSFVTISLIIALITSLLFMTPLPLLLPLAVFASYLSIHSTFFFLALKDNGIFFTIYALILNLFFCLVISSAGAIGTIQNKIR